MKFSERQHRSLMYKACKWLFLVVWIVCAVSFWTCTEIIVWAVMLCISDLLTKCIDIYILLSMFLHRNLNFSKNNWTTRLAIHGMSVYIYVKFMSRCGNKRKDLCGWGVISRIALDITCGFYTFLYFRSEVWYTCNIYVNHHHLTGFNNDTDRVGLFL